MAGSSTAAGTVSGRIAVSPGAIRPTPVGMNTETASLVPGLGFPTPPIQAARSLRPAIVDKALRCGPCQSLKPPTSMASSRSRPEPSSGVRSRTAFVG